MPVSGKGLGNPEFDSVLAAAQDPTSPSGVISWFIAPTSATNGIGDRDPGFMFLSMNVIQDPRMALTPMVYDGVFERFPRLRVARRSVVASNSTAE